MNFSCEIIGGIGTATTIGYFLSPIYEIAYMIKDGGDTTKNPYLIYIFTILNCLFWTLYGFIDKTWPLYVTEGTGLLLNYIYLLIFIAYLNTPMAQRGILMAIVSGIIIFLSVMFYFVIPSKEINGTLAAISDIFMGLSPFQYVPLIFKYKDNSYIPLSVTCFLAANNLVWSLFGFLKDVDYVLIIPNFLGLLFNLLQISIWVQFYDLKENNLNKEEGLLLLNKETKLLIESSENKII